MSVSAGAGPPEHRPLDCRMTNGRRIAKGDVMVRSLYLIAGLIALGLGAIGLFLPLLPTVPFLILAAFCFARSSQRLEAWLLAHPRYGPHIHAWRERGAISRRGKRAAFAAFALSILLGFLLLAWPWSLLPVGAALVSGSWIATRPN